MKKNNIIYLNGLIDLALARLGSKIVYKTDEFFAPAKRIDQDGFGDYPVNPPEGSLPN